MPEHAPLKITDIFGLIIICLGLGCYRFAHDAWIKYVGGMESERRSSHNSDGSKKPLLDLLIDAENIIDSTTDGGDSSTDVTNERGSIKSSEVVTLLPDEGRERTSSSGKRKARNSKGKGKGSADSGSEGGL
jgi:hypothetical protein